MAENGYHEDGKLPYPLSELLWPFTSRVGRPWLRDQQSTSIATSTPSQLKKRWSLWELKSRVVWMLSL